MEPQPTHRFMRALAALAVGSLLPSLAGAATAPEATPLHSRPDPDAPVIGTLPAGASYSPLAIEELIAEGTTGLAHGWVGLRHAGPFFGFARNTSVAKDLVLQPASPIHARPDAESPVIHTVGEQETVDVVEPSAGWVKVVFHSERVVYARMNDAAASAPDNAEGAAAAPAASEPTVVRPDAEDPSSQLVRGYLLKVRPLWTAGQRYDYQLVDEDNQRIVLLDLSELLPTEPIANLENRLVEVFGAPHDAPDADGVVIGAQTIGLATAPTP